MQLNIISNICETAIMNNKNKKHIYLTSCRYYFRKKSLSMKKAGRRQTKAVTFLIFP